MARYLRSFFSKDELHKHYTVGEKLGQGNFATVRGGGGRPRHHAGSAPTRARR